MIIKGKYNLQFNFLAMIKRLAGRKNKLKGRMWPAGRTLATPDLETTILNLNDKLLRNETVLISFK